MISVGNLKTHLFQHTPSGLIAFFNFQILGIKAAPITINLRDFMLKICPVHESNARLSIFWVVWLVLPLA
jgi:hypothetical protein